VISGARTSRRRREKRSATRPEGISSAKETVDHRMSSVEICAVDSPVSANSSE
jgi:hypothetical protein